MTSISLIDVLTIVFVLVDDWYQSQGQYLVPGKPGVKPTFRDSEVITLMLMQDFIPYPSETQYIAFIRANYLDLFPHLLTQSQFNRRSRGLGWLVEKMRLDWIRQKGWHEQSNFLLDTKPVPVVGYKRNKQQSDFLGSADFGVCASKNLKYFGYKLVTISTFNGLPLFYDLVSANTDEREAAETVIDHFVLCDLFGDKGFIGLDWQMKIFDQTGNLIWTPQRANQKTQNSPALNRFLSTHRERIEGVFHELQDVGRNLERLLAKTIVGLAARIVAKVTSHLLRRLLWVDFAVNVQTFEVASAS